MSASKTYRVKGPHRVDGHAPGSEFKARYSTAHERYLVTAGHITVVHSTSSKSTGGHSSSSSSSD